MEGEKRETDVDRKGEIREKGREGGGERRSDKRRE